AEDGIRDDLVTGVQTCALPIFELRFHAGEKFAFLFRNAESLEGALNVVRDFVPTAFCPRAGREVITDFVEIDCFEIFACPVRRRSEERRVGKEVRSRSWTEHEM